jgi:PAS domain S-box-containing protein
MFLTRERREFAGDIMKRGKGINGVFHYELRSLPWPLLIIFLFLIAAIIVAGFAYYQKQKEDILSGQISQLGAIADLKAAEIGRWLKERTGDANVIAGNPFLTAGLLAFLHDRSAAPRRESIRSWMKSLQGNFHYQNILLLDGSGEVAISLQESQPYVGSTGVDVLEAARRAKQVVISDLHRSAEVRFPHLDIAIPLLAENRIAGFILLRDDPVNYLYPMIQSWPTPSPSAETLLVRREGDSVLFLNELRHRKNTALKLRIPLSSNETPAVMAILGKTGAVFGNDYRGIAVWSVLRAVPDSPWFIVAKVDREEIEGPLRRSALAVFLITLSMLLAAALLTLFLWQRQGAISRLRQLEAEAKFRQTFEFSPVGIVMVGLDKRFTSSNEAFSKSLGYAPEELIGKSIADITFPDDIHVGMDEMKAIARGELAVSQVQKRYLHKNGRIIWGEATISLIRDHKADPQYFMAIIQDISERKQAEKTLAESEKKLRALFETMSEGIVYEDHAGNIISANPAAERLLGLSLEQLQGRTSLDPRWKAIHEDGSPFPGESHSLNVAAKTGKPAKGEVMGIYNPQSGAYVWLSVNSTPEFLPGEQQPFRAFAVFRDITDRKQAETNLQRLSARNQAMLEAIPDIIMEVDANKVYTWANHAGLAFFGDDVIGKEASFYFEGEQQTYLAVKPIFNGQENVIYVESWQRRHDGGKRLLAWWCRVLKDEAGTVTGALSSARDITEINRAEQALRESERKFRETVITLDEGYYSVTLDGKLLEHNQAFNRILGFALHEDLKGIQLPDFWQDPDQRKEYLMAFAASGSISNYEINAKTQKGNKITILTSSHLVKDESGQPQLIVGVFVDISQRRRAEAEIKQLNEELEQRVLQRTTQLESSNKELEAFSYSVSHDLRAPLRAIDGFSRIVLEEYSAKLDDEGKRLLTVVRDNTQKMGHLIDDLLAFSRLGRQQIAFVPVNLATLANVVFAELAAAEKGRRIEFKAGQFPQAYGDYPMLQQVLQNLLANAVKFTRPRAKPRIEFGGRAAGSENVYFVKDNGVGFDMEYVSKLFGVFQRLHGTDEFEGTGVGLAIVQRIVQRHGGRVWAESKDGKGATFYFSLPTGAGAGAGTQPAENAAE